MLFEEHGRRLVASPKKIASLYFLSSSGKVYNSQSSKLASSFGDPRVVDEDVERGDEHQHTAHHQAMDRPSEEPQLIPPPPRRIRRRTAG